MNSFPKFLLTSVLIFVIIIPFTSCTEEDSQQTTEISQPLLGKPEVVTSGFQFTEGPYWHPDGFLLFSDIPANTIYKWEPGSTESEIYIQPSGNSNGIKAMPDGTLLLAQHAGRVSSVSDSLTPETIVQEFDGNRLNSPNDIAVRSDGLIYFTDPIFGVSEENRELDIRGVFRINPDRSLTLVYEGFDLPNGIVFSPDENYLYVNDSATGTIIRFSVQENGDLSDGSPFTNIGEMTDMGGADGMTVDADGNLYTTGPNGILVFDNSGEEIFHLTFDQQVTNLAWEGTTNDALYVTSRGNVYRIPVNK